MQPATSARTNSRDRLQALLPQLFNQQKLVGDTFLRLQLDGLGPTGGHGAGTMIAIPLNYIEETKTLNGDQITTMPNLPPYILGLMAAKGQVFWAISLTQLWNLAPDWQNRQQYEVAVIRLNADTEPGDDPAADSWVGLVVPKIRGTLRVPSSAMGAIDPHHCPIPIAQLLGMISHDDNPLWVLNIDSLRQSLESAI
jgi:positive phototaxis protein PixI